MTDMTARAPGAPQFTIGRVIGTSFAVFIRNIVPFAIIAAVVSAPLIILERTYKIDLVELQAMAIQGHFPPGLGTQGLLYLVVIVITSSLTKAALVYGTFQDLRGQKASIGESLTRGFSALAPVLLAALAYAIIWMIGFVLLIIPSILIVVALWVYVPAIVVEKQGIGASFTRSRELTQGRRWAIFGLLILIAVIEWLTGWVTGFVLALALGDTGIEIAGAAVRILAGSFSAVAIAVSYYFLRADKEGIAIDEIAQVFD